ncbi:AMIN domain-containing protein [[Limnothrix rosea] IAM M-220]|uniref:AMIN domain-containing protein n=1 Tax=[Limnothrix rosea] IAM M-220 TaxID=454133 RepID=UPI0015594CAF|nr:AMIN domain-containing protein [[Limnothrix rosea] IAM M-220]
MVAISLIWQTGAIAETLFPVIQGWTFSQQEQSLAFQTHAGAQPSFFVLREPSRIVVDVQGASWEKGTVTQPFRGKISQIRVAEFTEGVTRFVLETSNPNTVINTTTLKLRSFPTDDGDTLWQLSLGNTSNANALNSTTNHHQNFPPALLPPVIRGSVTVPSPPIPDNLRK